MIKIENDLYVIKLYVPIRFYLNFNIYVGSILLLLTTLIKAMCYTTFDNNVIYTLGHHILTVINFNAYLKNV